MSEKILPSRFQIGDTVRAGKLDGGDLAEVVGVRFSKAKVSYDVRYRDGKNAGMIRKVLSDRVHEE